MYTKKKINIIFRNNNCHGRVFPSSAQRGHRPKCMRIDSREDKLRQPVA